MKTSLFILYISFISLSPIISQTEIDELATKIEEVFKSSSIHGLGAAIVNKDEILFENSFGYADIANKKPYDRNSLHNIGSTSKTFIGIAIMQLVEQGKLDLDADINDILPFKVQNPHHLDKPITIRQLSTHSSSIRDRNLNYALRAYISRDSERGIRKGLPLMYKVQFKKMLKNEDLSLGDFLEESLSKKGKWYSKKNFYKQVPGSDYNYSNIGAGLAGYIIEIISGENYDDYVINHILKPLKMEASGWSKGQINESKFAERYINSIPFPDYHLTTYPDGGLISSMSDLCTYLQAMIGGYMGEKSILTSASFQEMMSNQFQQEALKNIPRESQDRSGIFWDIYGKKGRTDIGHNGSDPGILSFMYFDPDTGLGCILLTNTDAEDDNIRKLIEIWELLIKYRNLI